MVGKGTALRRDDSPFFAGPPLPVVTSKERTQPGTIYSLRARSPTPSTTTWLGQAAFTANATYRDALDADSRNAYTLARWGLTWESWLAEGGEIANEDNCDAAASAKVATVWRSDANRPDHYRALIAHIPTDDAFVAYLRDVACPES